MIYNNIFLTDLDVLAIQNLPTKWRNPIHIAFLKVLILPFKFQFQRLKEERERNIYILSHDARLGRLEKVLNDRFDASNRSIRIGPGNRIQSLYLYTEAEGQQTYFPKYVYTQKEIAERNTDFIVLVPMTVTLDIQELETMVYLTRYYSNKDKQFKIERT